MPLQWGRGQVVLGVNSELEGAEECLIIILLLHHADHSPMPIVGAGEEAQRVLDLTRICIHISLRLAPLWSLCSG